MKDKFREDINEIDGAMADAIKAMNDAIGLIYNSDLTLPSDYYDVLIDSVTLWEEYQQDLTVL